ncbi:RHS repeat-associated core domain-containing protein, partial [Flavobacterium silvaticum]
VTQVGQTERTLYLDGFQYVDDVLQFFPHPEGYVRATPKENHGEGQSEYDFSYVYQYKDHLGNIRMNYAYDFVDGETKILNEDHYYPFGLKHSNYSSGKKDFAREEEQLMIKPTPFGEENPYLYKYNGKEWQDELGLNLYDYGARNYDPAIGRWMNIDPLAEKYDRFSPYAYAVDNPVLFVDPDGMRIRWGTWSDVQNDEELSKQFKTRGEYRAARRELKKQYRETLKNSATASSIYQDLDDDSKTHTILAQKTNGGATTMNESGEMTIKIGVGDGTDKYLDGISSQEANIQAIVGHEGGHGWAKLNGLESELSGLDVNTATQADVDNRNATVESRERFASHIENMVRAELINSGTQNMSLRSKYPSTKAIYLGQSPPMIFTFEKNAYQLLQNNPYTPSGYLNGIYKLPITKR